jgi:hypothetical protein
MTNLQQTFFDVTVTGYIYVFGSCLLGEALFKNFIEDISFPSNFLNAILFLTQIQQKKAFVHHHIILLTFFSGHWLVMMEIFPGFSLYRGIYELAEYASAGRNMGKPGMQWADLNDPINGMQDVLILMSVEWTVLLVVAFLLDHRPTWRPLFLFGLFSTKHSSPSRKPDRLKRRSSRVHVDMEKADVILEVSQECK